MHEGKPNRMRSAGGLLLLALQAEPAAVPPDPVREGRAARIARTSAAIEAQAQAVDAFGHADEFAAALARIRDEAGGEKWFTLPSRGGPQNGPKGGRSEGALLLTTINTWLGWNRPAEGRQLPGALDLELDGHPCQAIADLSRQVTAHGIEFLFVCFPTRVECYPELVLPGLADSADAKPPFRGLVGQNPRFLLELANAGVEVVDLTTPFVEQRFDADEKRALLYHRGNLHWTPRAAELAAKLVADRIAEMPWFKPGPYRDGQAFDVRRRDAQFQADGGGQAPGMEPETVGLNCVQMKSSPLTKDDKRRGPIVLLGDSFTDFHREYGAAFHDQLFRFTGWPIDLVAPPGGGELACRDALRRRADGLANKMVVIWLLQEAALAPSTQFRKVDLFPE